MNTFFKQMSMAVLCAMMIVPLCGMQNENGEVVNATEIIQQQPNPAAWYKKRSVRIGAAAITGVAAIYAFAVRMGMVAIPALFAGIFVAKITQPSIVHAEENDNKNSNNVVSQSVDDSSMEQKDDQQADEYIDSDDRWPETAYQDITHDEKRYVSPRDYVMNWLIQVAQKSGLDTAVSRVKGESLLDQI